MKNLEEIDSLEETMDVLIRGIRKYENADLNDSQKRGMLHMKRRYCRYQVEHKKLTGSYYLIER